MKTLGKLKPAKDKTLKRRMMRNDELYIEWLEAGNRSLDEKLTKLLQAIETLPDEHYEHVLSRCTFVPRKMLESYKQKYLTKKKK